MEIYAKSKDGKTCDVCGLDLVLSVDGSFLSCSNGTNFLHRSGIDMDKNKGELDEIDHFTFTLSNNYYSPSQVLDIVQVNQDRKAYAVDYDINHYHTTIGLKSKILFSNNDFDKNDGKIFSVVVCEDCWKKIVSSPPIKEGLYKPLTYETLGKGIGACVIYPHTNDHSDRDYRKQLLKNDLKREYVRITLQRMNDKVDQKLVELLENTRIIFSSVWYQSAEISEHLNFHGFDVDFKKYINSRLVKLAKEGKIERKDNENRHVYVGWIKKEETYSKKLAYFRGINNNWTYLILPLQKEWDVFIRNVSLHENLDLFGFSVNGEPISRKEAFEKIASHLGLRGEDILINRNDFSVKIKSVYEPLKTIALQKDYIGRKPQKKYDF